MKPMVRPVVFVVYYWTGFCDAGERILGIFRFRRDANAKIRSHKRNRNKLYEYDAKSARWRIERRAIRTTNDAHHMRDERRAT